MTAAQKIEPLDRFYSDLPNKPYCTDHLGTLYVRPKAQAAKKKYIQHNQPCLISYFVFDVDRPDATLAWFDANLPMPYWTSQNPENGHCHICYRLQAILLRKQGLSYSELAKALNISRKTAINWCSQVV